MRRSGESFVKTFKRDDVYVNRLDTAESVLRDVAAWIDEHNEHRPDTDSRCILPERFAVQLQPADVSGLAGATPEQTFVLRGTAWLRIESLYR